MSPTLIPNQIKPQLPNLEIKIALVDTSALSGFLLLFISFALEALKKDCRKRQSMGVFKQQWYSLMCNACSYSSMATF